MRVPSGKVDVSLYFVAVNATDYITRETGLSSFTVFRSRNGAAEVQYTTPTVAEIDATNMPGVYALLLDEDTTIAAGSDNEEYCVHITHAGMAPVTRTIELYRRDTTSGQTIDVSSGGVEVGSFQAGAITAAAIATDAIDADALADGAITAATFAAGAITATVIATDAIDNDALAANAVTEIQSGLSTLDAAGVRTAVGLASANLDTQLSGIQSDTNDIQTRLPAALVSGRMASDVIALSGSTTAADNAESGFTALVVSTCATGSTTTSIVTNLTEATNDHYSGRVITFTSGALAGQSSSISDYDGGTKTLTVVALTEAPVNTDAFVIS